MSPFSPKDIPTPHQRFRWKLKFNSPHNKKHYTWPRVMGYGSTSRLLRWTCKWYDHSARITRSPAWLHSSPKPPETYSILSTAVLYLCAGFVSFCESPWQPYVKSPTNRPQRIIKPWPKLPWTRLSRAIVLVLTLQDVFIKCMYSFGHNDGQGSSAQQPGTQNSHQL